MKIVVDCLLTLRSRLIVNGGGYELSAASLARLSSVTHKGASESNFCHVLPSPVKSGMLILCFYLVACLLVKVMLS